MRAAATNQSTTTTTIYHGVTIRFAPHPNTACPFLHHTLNNVYGLDLYENDFHFLFDDIAANQQTELHKDAPKRLLNHMIDHITRESGTGGTRSKTDKVESLFKTMILSYKMKNGTIVKFKRGQDLATGMVHFIKNQRDDVPTKCIEVLL